MNELERCSHYEVLKQNLNCHKRERSTAYTTTLVSQRTIDIDEIWSSGSDIPMRNSEYDFHADIFEQIATAKVMLGQLK